jgi:hypothetical protein
MIRQPSEPRPELGKSLLNVLRQAEEAGAPVPQWVAVEDETGDWIREVAAMSSSERARGVVAIGTVSAIEVAIRLGVGGALRLPPSTVHAIAAFEAAARAQPGFEVDPRLVDLAVSADDTSIVVSWDDRALWRCQLGDREMDSLMRDLAGELGVLPALFPGPALVVSGKTGDEIRATWRKIAKDRAIAGARIQLRSSRPPSGHCGAVDVVLEALVQPAETVRDPGENSTMTQPVYELPSGRRVGCWSPSKPGQAAADGWVAWPEGETEVGYRWRLRHPNGGEQTIDDVLAVDTVDSPALRVPGWVTASLDTGRPAALVVEQLGEAAHRAGVPLWVANVNQQALELLLGLPGTLWVDGPAAPREE